MLWVGSVVGSGLVLSGVGSEGMLVSGPEVLVGVGDGGEGRLGCSGLPDSGADNVINMDCGRAWFAVALGDLVNRTDTCIGILLLL